MAYPVISHELKLEARRVKTPRILVPECPSHPSRHGEVCRKKDADLHRSLLRTQDPLADHVIMFPFLHVRSTGFREAACELILFAIGHSPTTLEPKIHNVLYCFGMESTP